MVDFLRHIRDLDQNFDPLRLGAFGRHCRSRNGQQANRTEQRAFSSCNRFTSAVPHSHEYRAAGGGANVFGGILPSHVPDTVHLPVC